ncbi:MAG: GAF domain-containing protein, partial [Caldilineaceae bacterium]|nr:GAF domain-containing protein [Caldilineaceae bacterium]
ALTNLKQMGLRRKIILWAFVPTAIILMAVASVNYIAYRRVAETLILERDEEVTRLAAGQIATSLTEYADLLVTEERNALLGQGDLIYQQAALRSARNRLAIFDGGLVLLDGVGAVVAAEPVRSEIMGADWAQRPYFRQVLRTGRPVFSNTLSDGPQGSPVVAVAVPVLGSQDEMMGVLVGMFQLGATSISTFYGDIVRLRVGRHGIAYLVDGTGQVIYHSVAAQIGEDFSAESVVQQVLGGSVLSAALAGERMGAIRTRDRMNNEIVAGFAHVPGTEWGLVTETSWETLLGMGNAYQRFLLLLFVLGILTPALFVSIGTQRIIQPVIDMIGAAKKVAAGDFTQTIVTNSGDEIDILAAQFNRMSAQLRASYTGLENRVAERTRVLSALIDIAAAVNRSLDLQETLTHSLEKTLQVLGIEAGGIYLLNETGTELELAVHRGYAPELVEEMDHLAMGEGFNGFVMQHCCPLVVDEIADDDRLARTAVREAGVHSLVSVPLYAKERPMGTLFTTTYAPRKFSDEDINLLTSIGYQVGVAIENALLYGQAQQLAALEERSRLARELHDSVTQALYSQILLVEGWKQMVQNGELTDLTEPLEELGQVTKHALKEMRLLVYELRPLDLEKEGLVGALHKRLNAVEKRAGIEARLITEGILADLPLELEENLYRIAQEALANALKHADAQQVIVRLSSDTHAVILEVTDDGCGFDPAPLLSHRSNIDDRSSVTVVSTEASLTNGAQGNGSANQGDVEEHTAFQRELVYDRYTADGGEGQRTTISDNGGMGLINMRERAEKFRGTFTVTSTPGTGVKIRVEIPVGKEGN